MTGLVPRRVTTNELWKLQGRTVVELEEAMKKFGKTEAEMVYEGTRATGVHTAANLLSVAGYIVVCMQAQERRAGMGRDFEGAKAMAQILLWLRRWRRGEMRRSAPAYAGGGERTIFVWVEAWWFAQVEDHDEDDREDRKAGGRRKKVEEVIANVALSKELTLPRPFRGDDVGGRVEEWVEECLTGDKAASTEKAYQGSWAKWKAWAKRQGWHTEYLNYKDDPVENENKVLTFVGYMGLVGGFRGDVEAGDLCAEGCAQESWMWRPDGQDAPIVDVGAFVGKESSEEAEAVRSDPPDAAVAGGNACRPLRGEHPGRGVCGRSYGYGEFGHGMVFHAEGQGVL